MTDKTMPLPPAPIPACTYTAPDGVTQWPAYSFEQLQQFARDATTRHLSQPAERGEVVEHPTDEAFGYVQQCVLDSYLQSPSALLEVWKTPGVYADVPIYLHTTERGEALGLYQSCPRCDGGCGQSGCSECDGIGFVPYAEAPPPAAGVPDVPQEWKSLLANLAAVVRVQNGNKHADINAMLNHADTLLSAAPSPAIDVAAVRDAKRLQRLIDLCGHVEDGSDVTVKLYQDDATRDWFVHAGKHWWHGSSPRAAIDATDSPG